MDRWDHSLCFMIYHVNCNVIDIPPSFRFAVLALWQMESSLCYYTQFNTPSAAGLNSFILAYFYYMEKKFDVPGILHLESKVWYICRWSVMKFLILEWWAPPAQWPEVFGQIPL